MHFTVPIGGQPALCRLPLMPARFILRQALQSALGFRLNDAGDDWIRGEDGKPVTDPDYDAFATVQVAALGVCWAGEPLGVRRFTSSGTDVLAYGTEVWGALIERGVEVADIYAAARAAMDAVNESIPTAKEVDEAEGNSAAPAASSTPPT